MTPGLVLVVQPKGCKAPVRVRTIGSGYTFDAAFWTDGKMEAPMLPDRIELLNHSGEQVLFWVEDAEQIEEIGIYEKSLRLAWLAESHLRHSISKGHTTCSIPAM